MSTLHVENLKGLSSGGNANKVIVPSGQTIDASAGTLIPSAGHIVQHVTSDITSPSSTVINTTSYSDITGATVNITPKYQDSVILIMFDIFVYIPANKIGYLLITDGSNNSIGGVYTPWSQSSNRDLHISGHQHYSFNSTSQQTVKLRAKANDTTNQTWGGQRQLTLSVLEIKQ